MSKSSGRVSPAAQLPIDAVTALVRHGRGERGVDLTPARQFSRVLAQAGSAAPDQISPTDRFTLMAVATALGLGSKSELCTRQQAALAMSLRLDAAIKRELGEAEHLQLRIDCCRVSSAIEPLIR
jgi:hypothetical protein